jgi:ribosomal protein S6--L-glutamate ligase
MKFAIISKNSPIIEVKELKIVLEEKGHEVIFINPVFSLNQLFSDDFWSTYLNVDLLYYRTGFGDAAGLELFRKLLDYNIPSINKVVLRDIILSNKIHQLILMKKEGVLVPNTLIGRGHSYKNITEVLGGPFILKAANGIQGTRVFLIHTEEEYINKLSLIDGDLLMQEFIKNSGDYRVFVVGSKVEAIFQRIPKEGDFRSNISQGGKGLPVPEGDLYNRLSEIALKVSSSQGLDIVGVDLMLSDENDQIYFIESNINPGWKGLEEVLGISMTSIIADYLISRASTTTT